jgi:hypothetical protein
MAIDGATTPNLHDQNVEIKIPDSSESKVEVKSKKKTDGWFMKSVKAVWNAVKWIFKVIVGVGLFITNPSFFAVGFVAGIVFSEKVREAVNRVKLVWDKQPWTVSIILGLGAFLALPITLATSALLFGGNLGSSLTEYAQDQLLKKDDSSSSDTDPKLFGTGAIKV